ncbi:MAG TPA: glycoside hydrolase, partial [Pseudonocardiaceae bacterium]
YVHCNGLAGTMMFSMYDLNDPTNTLFNDVVNDLAGTTSSCTNPPPPTTGTNPPPTTTTTAPPTTTTAGSGGCTGLAAWNVNTSYVPNDVVSFGGHKWTSLYWSTGVTPGSPIAWNIWKDNGAC